MVDVLKRVYCLLWIYILRGYVIRDYNLIYKEISWCECDIEFIINLWKSLGKGRELSKVSNE